MVLRPLDTLKQKEGKLKNKKDLDLILTELTKIGPRFKCKHKTMKLLDKTYKIFRT